jgi:hypothetical protein
MHADAMPDADPEALQDPRSVARIIVQMLDHPGSSTAEGRFVASRWEASP